MVEELSQLKRSIKSLDEDRTSYLVSILCSLAACLSLINQQAHESLLSEVLGLPLWNTARVRAFSYDYKPVHWFACQALLDLACTSHQFPACPIKVYQASDERPRIATSR